MSILYKYYFHFPAFDQTEQVDRLQFMYQEETRGDNILQLDQMITAIIEKLPQYQCLTTEHNGNTIPSKKQLLYSEKAKMDHLIE